jgi:hypothetical protein
MTTLTSSSPSEPRAEPRWETPRSPERETFGHAIIAVARKLNQPLMPWQEQVALVGGELVTHESGLMVPAYREVVFTVPRQNGKTTLILAWEIQRALGWAGPQKIAYSAQTGSDARKKLLEDQFPLLEPRKKTLGIKPAGLRRANGNEGVEFRNGSRLVLLASTEDAGHGKTLDMAVKDELFADTDDRRDQALRPAMVTRPAAQVLACSTAGTDESLPWNELVDRGRAAVDAGERSEIAYFEWSAPRDCDADDPAVWWSCMPALGLTITENVIRGERRGMKDGEFRRAFLNISTRSDDRVIPAQAWQDVNRSDAKPLGSLVFSVEVNEERTAGSIVVASCGPVPVCEVVDQRAATGWLIERCAELSKRWGRPPFVIDGRGPAGVLVGDLERAGVRVQLATTADMTAACGGFYDAVVEQRVVVRPHPALDAAVAAAVKKWVGDAWVWARRSATADVSTLVGASLATWQARATIAPQRPAVLHLEDYLDEE